MRFKSRKDWWLTIIIWGSVLVAIGSAGYGLIVKYATLLEFFIIILCAIVVPIFMLWFWFTTEYIIAENHLIIRCGPFKNKILLKNIKSVRKTKNPLSSPALSLRRLEISYDTYNSVLISPKNREEFIKTLTEQYPHIKELSKWWSLLNMSVRLSLIIQIRI